MPNEVLIDGVQYVPKSDVDAATTALNEQIEVLEETNDTLVYELNAAQDQIGLLQGMRYPVEEIKDRAETLLDILGPSIDPDDKIDGDVISADPGSPTIQQMIDDGSMNLYLKAGTYHQQIDLSGKSNITIQAFPGDEGKVEINGLSSATWEWEYDETFDWYVGQYPGIPKLWIWQDNDVRGSFNNRNMYPVLATIGDEPLIWGEPDELLLIGGQFVIKSDPDKSGYIYVRLKEGQSIEDFRISPFDRLMWGDEATSNITFKGDFLFKGCSNTGKTGAVNFPGSNWNTEEATITVELVNTIGIEFGQGGLKSGMRSTVLDSKFGVLIADMCGQMGFWGSAKRCEIKHMEHIKSNWKGFDPWWEASIKLEGWEDCTILVFVAFDCNGQGLWFDIANHRNIVAKLLIRNCMLAGLMLEHYADANDFMEIDIGGITKAEFDPATSWGVVCGILVQSNVTRCTFDKIAISGVEDGIRINNTDTRGNSDNNTFTNHEITNFTGEAIKVLGDTLSNTF